MKADLIKARNHIIKARPLLRRHFKKRLWPVFYEDIDYLIQAVNDCLEAIRKHERLPL